MASKPEDEAPDFPDEWVGIVAWRIECLVKAGYESDHAGVIATTENWRKALDLKEHGCPDDLAVAILT